MKTIDLEHQAEWIMGNLTKANKNLIQDALSLEEPTTRNILLLSNLKQIAADRNKALAAAIENGDCPSERFPDFRTQKKREAVADYMVKYVDMDQS